MKSEEFYYRIGIYIENYIKIIEIKNNIIDIKNLVDKFKNLG